MKILVTGPEGKLSKTVAKALSPPSGTEIVRVPPDSQLLRLARARSVQALVFVLHTEDDLEPLRWLLQQNRSLPVVAVLVRRDATLEAQLRTEGVSQIVVGQERTAAQLRRELAEALAKLRSRRGRAARNGALPELEWHAIRSTLTAILGNAELALKAARSAVQKHQLQEIVRGVAEIEQTLRCLERTARFSKP